MRHLPLSNSLRVFLESRATAASGPIRSVIIKWRTEERHGRRWDGWQRSGYGPRRRRDDRRRFGRRNFPPESE